MKKFKYRLEPLLKVKSHLEKEKQKIHAASLKKVHDQKSHLTDIDRQKTSTSAFQRRTQQGAICLAELLVCSRFMLKLKKDTLAGSEMLRVMETDAEEKRQDLVEASKQRKIYEKLKERQHEKFDRELKDLEQKDADEVANTSFIRQGRT